MDLSSVDYELPPERIAQAPLAERDACRLMVVDRRGERPPAHRRFRDLRELLAPGALLVLNETRVIPARLLGRRASGGKVEVLLVHPLEAGAAAPGSRPGDWEALVRAGGTLRPPDEVLELEGGRARLRVAEALGAGRYRVRLEGGQDALTVAEDLGRIPLPPYVHREATAADREDYQTVFARVPGAIAAPTAGLHFTPALLADLEARGVELARVLLHVGPGTFLPVRTERVEDHTMEAERYEVPAPAREAIARARAEGRPVVCCGTTAVRAVESYALRGEPAGWTDLFIYPPYRFRLVDALITNFHLPRSTLLLLVGALAGVENVLSAYREAVREGYRFYSYGDAMLIMG